MLKQLTFSRNQKKWLIAGGAALLLLLILAISLPSPEPMVRARLLRTLEERFNGTAELEALHLSFFPGIRANGSKLLVRYKGRKDLPPLVSIEEFYMETGWLGLLKSPARIREVNLRGLAIHIPPDQERNPKENHPTSTDLPKVNDTSSDFVIETVHADNAVLRVLPKKRISDPLIFELYKFTLHSVGFNHPIQFDAKLKNAKPPGLIQANGEFGPWQKVNPARTPVHGEYTFQNADLSVFKGISGLLSSVGKFKGVLQEIIVDGTTDTPNFKVRLGNHPVDLKTEFHAVVDGTNGDTRLQPVTARFGKTVLICNGAIAKIGKQKGKTVALDVRSKEGRIEDLMKFAVPSRAPLTGNISFTGKLELPPDDQDVIQKLMLNGLFNVTSAEFTTPAVQEKVEELSMRSRGQHEDSTNERIVSNMRGHFVLKDATVTFSDLAFVVPGAQVQLNGEYRVVRKDFDFRGTVTMEAKLSETQKGIKSFFLKIVDPFFKKGKAGAVLPIKISGTLKEPEVGLDLLGKKK